MANIVAYLSHSYHPADRSINMAIWRRLNALNVTFKVDPPSAEHRPMDVTFLERMMQRSQAFVAIVPDRSRANGAAPSASSWSAYQEFECRLAMRANKPRLIIVEQGIELGPLSDGDSTGWFVRSPLDFDPDLDEKIAHFVDEAVVRPREPAVMPKMGILRWAGADKRWLDFCAELQRRVGHALADVVDVDEDTYDHDLLNAARNRTLLVVDISPRNTPAHVVGLLHGAAVPTFRTCLLETTESEQDQDRQLRLMAPGDGGDSARDERRAGADSAVALPLLFRGYRVDAGMRPIHFWEHAKFREAAEAVARLTTEYRSRERRLETQESADEYFLKLRGNRVFISTSSELAAWTIPLKEALETAGMPAFHYKVPEIEVGTEWMPELRQRIAEADLFMAFVSPGYWKSRVCVDELVLAVERWEQHQLIILVGTLDQTRPLPPFLSRYQNEVLSNPESDKTAIVRHVRARFERVGRDDARSVDLLSEPLARHMAEAEVGNPAAFLENVGGMAKGEAAAMADLAGGDVAKLVKSLINRARTERSGATALGRVCLWMRRREPDPDVRRALTRQVSALRLFSGLHDIRAWLDRRSRMEVSLAIASRAPRQTLEVVTSLAGDHANALDVVRQLGSEIAKCLEPSVQGLLDPGDRRRVTIPSTVDDMMVPVEWAVPSGETSPLARARVVLRRLADVSAARESLEDLFDDNVAAPPRVLLFGYGGEALPFVRTELDEIAAKYTQRYTAAGWPTELVESISGDAATAAALRHAITEGDFDIVHLAGHAGGSAGGPMMQVAPDAEGRGDVASGDLQQWLRRSSVRFVYLSCCNTASTPLGPGQFAGWRQTMCRDVLEAGVPEVAGYFWPVRDLSAAHFAVQFHQAYMRNFDAPGAMLSARRSAPPGDPTWAGSIIVRSAGRGEHG